MTTISTRNDLRDYLDRSLPFLGEEGRLAEAVDALRCHDDRPEWGEDWAAWLGRILGEDGNGIYDLIGELEAVEGNGTYGVRATAGGVWWPSEEAAEEIEAADNPAETALRICRDQPMRGKWHA